MNTHALTVLEFERTLERVASRTANSMGREAVMTLRPESDPGRVREELARVSETVSFLQGRSGWAPPAFPDLSGVLQTLGVEGGVLTSGELASTLRFLASSRILAEAFEGSEDADPAGPLLDPLRESLPVRPALEELLDGIVDEDGEVRDDATPELREVRRSLRTARGRIVRRLEDLLDGLSDRIRVDGASVSVRDGRYVIPIRREGKSEVGGVIRGESASGQSLFVEPPLAIRLMNEISEMEREEEREVLRILREATGRLRPERDALEGGLLAHVDFDSLQARARTALAWGGTAPEIAEPGDGELRVVGGRHPLLLEQGVEVIPFWLELTPDERVVVVSGPNTGGKTVFLKAVGLVHLLAQSGIVPPVEDGTRIPAVTEVFADIGDEQSITESLSTFSAHMSNAREILEEAGPGSLVLMDEMGTGTDPSEGAALARAILEALVERGARAFATSHLGALKRLDTEGSGIVNASLLFDPERIAPTYELRKGRPGRSYGLAIARRLGLPGDVLDRAEAFVDSGELRVEALLESLEARERELSEALSEAEADRTAARDLRTANEELASRLEEREKASEARAREQARELLLEARREVEEAIGEVRRAAGDAVEEAGTSARRKVEAAARDQRERAPERGAGSASPGTSSGVAEGQRVKVLGSGARGVVRELRDDRVTVEVGGMRLRLPREEIEPVAAGGTKGGPDPAPERTSEPSGGSLPEIEVRSEADLRGLRVDEVDTALARALDGAVVAGLAELRIIHGKGTGAVKARVLELLKGEGRVRECRPGGPAEGGAGVTVVVFR